MNRYNVMAYAVSPAREVYVYAVTMYAVTPYDPDEGQIVMYGVWPEPTITLYAVSPNYPEKPYKWYPCAPESDPEKERKEIEKLKERIQKLEEILKLKEQLKKLEKEVQDKDECGSITTTSIGCTTGSSAITNDIK